MTTSKRHSVAAFFLLAQAVLLLATASAGLPEDSAPEIMLDETPGEPESEKRPPTTKLFDEDYLYGRGRDSWDLDLECRKYPLWRGILGPECKEHLEWKPLQPWWWEAQSSDYLGEVNISEIEACMEQEFLEYMKTWPE
jgi:hypothetical protein